MGVRQASTRGFMCRELAAELARHGKYYTVRWVTPKIKSLLYQNGVIVYIKKSSRYPDGHYLTYFEGYWKDPWCNLVTDKDETVPNAVAGFRKRLPGRAQYALLPLLHDNQV